MLSKVMSFRGKSYNNNRGLQMSGASLINGPF
jgi:hypothetical protein